MSHYCRNNVKNWNWIIVKNNSMTEKLLEGVVLVDQVMPTVTVTGQSLDHDTHDKDPPQRHARTAKVMADIGGQVFLQKGGHVITVRATEANAGNGAAFTVGLDDMSHGAEPAKIDGYWMKKGPETCKCQNEIDLHRKISIPDPCCQGVL